VIGALSKLSVIRKPAAFARMFPTLDLKNALFVSYESIKRELKRRPIDECRCDERLNNQAEGSPRLAYTGLLGGRFTFPKSVLRGFGTHVSSLQE